MTPNKWAVKVSALPKHLRLDQVAARLKVSYTRASKITKALGYRCKRKPRDKDELVKRRVNRLIATGLSNVEIARALQVTREWVRQIRNLSGKPKVESRGRREGFIPAVPK